MVEGEWISISNGGYGKADERNVIIMLHSESSNRVVHQTIRSTNYETNDKVGLIMLSESRIETELDNNDTDVTFSPDALHYV